MNILFNPLPDDKILGLPKLKAFADEKLNATKNIKVVSHMIENIVKQDVFVEHECPRNGHFF